VSRTALFSWPHSSAQLIQSHRRLACRLLAFPLLAALAILNWTETLHGTRLLPSGNKTQESFFLVFSALTTGLAISIVLVPPKLHHRTRPSLPVPPGLMVWYCCALLSVPEFLVGLLRELVPGWVSVSAAFFVFLASQWVAPILLSVCGATCMLLALRFREHRPGLNCEGAFGFAVWVVCLIRAFLLWWWGPLVLDLP
jgi:hypothetical protein